jgi:hypothetical protein
MLLVEYSDDAMIDLMILWHCIGLHLNLFRMCVMCIICKKAPL